MDFLLREEVASSAKALFLKPTSAPKNKRPTVANTENNEIRYE
jgi:hypothetical protein